VPPQLHPLHTGSHQRVFSFRNGAYADACRACMSYVVSRRTT
jgi:hypothetical protein